MSELVGCATGGDEGEMSLLLPPEHAAIHDVNMSVAAMACRLGFMTLPLKNAVDRR
ncbi:hypothetical protein SB861_40245 [Paraburkholderia sp. SIMBA_049]